MSETTIYSSFVSDNLGATRKTIFEYAAEEYGSEPEFLWQKFPNYAVLRRHDNQKWYALIMDVPKNKLGLDGLECVDIIDIKCSISTIDRLIFQKGFLPAYHLSRKNWLTVLLDGSVDSELLKNLLDESYMISGEKTKNIK